MPDEAGRLDVRPLPDDRGVVTLLSVVELALEFVGLGKSAPTRNARAPGRVPERVADCTCRE